MKRKRKVYLIGAIILAGLAATAMKMLWGGQEVMVLQVRPGTITRSVTDSYVQRLWILISMPPRAPGWLKCW